MKKTGIFLLIGMLAFGTAGSAFAGETEEPSVSAAVQENVQKDLQMEQESFTGCVTEIQKYGNVVLNISAADLESAGYAYGDMLKVTVDGVEYEMPYGTNYSDVENGEYILRNNEGVLIIAINMGDFASTNGLAVKQVLEDETVFWEFPEGTGAEDIQVTISMGEKEGYLEQYLIHQLVRTNERADYDSDQIFANFRNISSGDLGENALYRSSSPVNSELGRAAYADDFVEEAGIQTVMNLADSKELIESYIEAADFDSPYYQSLFEEGNVIALNLGVDYRAEDFGAGFAEGLRFLASHEGPYLVHCTEGKDRAGFTSALLAAFMGATGEELIADYMETYENYYHLEEGTKQYEAVLDSNIIPMLEYIAGVEADVPSEGEKENSSEEEALDLSELDLAAGAENYMKMLGLTEEECEALRENLSRDYK